MGLYVTLAEGRKFCEPGNAKAEHTHTVPRSHDCRKRVCNFNFNATCNNCSPDLRREGKQFELFIAILGAGLDPQQTMRLEVLRWRVLVVASPSTLLSRSCCLLQSLSTTCSERGCDDYGVRSCVKAHDSTVMREAEGPLDQGVAMRFGVSTKEREETAQ
eukprot:6183756-Pleurochrysis_carterae.AAC.1